MVYHNSLENEMAIMHRNPMPLNGALFVTNPRRRKNARRRNGLATSRNSLAQRRNAISQLRRNATQMSLGFDEAINIASPKATAGTRKTTSSSKGKNMSEYKKLQAEAKKLGLKASGKTADLKRRIAAAKKKAKGSSKKSGGSRKASGWSMFQKKVKGLSLTRGQVQALYKKFQNDPKATQKKIDGFRKKVRAEAAKLKGAKVGRSYLRKGRESILAEGQFLNNPMKKINPRRRKNVGIAGVQPLAMPLAIVQDVQQGASKIPVVKFLSFAVTPLALGATVYGVHKLAEPHVMKLLESDLKVQNIPVLKETLKFPYTTTGVVAGLALGLLAKYKILDPQAAALVASSAVSVGIGLDLSLRSFAKAATDVASEAKAEATAEAAVAAAEAVEAMTGQPVEAIAAETAPADMGALHMGAIQYGDGGQYMIGRNSTALGNYGAIQMGAVHMGAAQSADPEYHDASPADARHCTCVMMPDEVAAAKAGRAAFARKFPSAPRNMKKTQDLLSRHAGRAGHRYGWLIKMIGFGNFQKIASLPPKRREIVISQLQKQAIASIPALLQAQARQNASLETASLPVEGTLNGVQGFQGVGYGAMMFAGQGY